MDVASLPVETVREVLDLNAVCQPWLPELGQGIDQTVRELSAYRERQ